MIRFALLMALSLAPVAALADEPVVTEYGGSFEDAAFALESAIVGQGLVIDFVSHVGDMLNRTAEDVGSDETLFSRADIYIFCSAVVSREVMEADPMNVAYCPYGIFVAERSGQVLMGRQDYPAGPMDKVEEMLDAIIAEATER